ncbi:unnamed protein product, partial [marine sediment metagenome]
AVDPDKPLQFMDIMKQLSGRFKDNTLTVAQLGDAFERFGLRSAPMFATLLKNWDEVINAGEKFNDITDANANLEEERLDNINSQWDMFIGHLSSYVAETSAITDLVRESLKGINALLESWVKKVKEITREDTLKIAILQAEKVNKMLKKRIDDREALNKKIRSQYKTEKEISRYINAASIEYLRINKERLEFTINYIKSLKKQLTYEKELTAEAFRRTESK